ncbi:hypothetical protein C8F04DRAFT_1265005 [Mycena alexandri]|uniref:Uncharacterized protein n=1 Tax=Mycena alexandri TaxID=1745969 RepID=A0AAD6SJU9_9AGAR|nr:hypothetical protein C8F04DRAFT_1265005 [Mycena alexandri]
MPRLWSSVCLHLCSSAECTLVVVASASAPVDALLRVVIAQSHQWRTVDLELMINAHSVKSLLPIPEPLPLLNGFSVEISSGISPPTISLLDAPKLRRVSVSMYNPQIQVPWHQLITFRTNDIHTSLPLRKSSSLLDGAFNIRGLAFTAPNCILQHPHLRTLALGVFLGVERTLTLQPPNPASNQALPSPDIIIHFILSRSSITLRTLALSHMPTTLDGPIECLRATPSVVDLKLELPPFVKLDNLYSQFIDQPDFLPKNWNRYIRFWGPIRSVSCR